MGNQDKIKEALSRIEQGLETINTNEDYLKFLRFQSLFYQYSFGNAILIYLQSGGNASYVKGYKAWNKLDRHVKKGAKALAVITNDAWWGDTPGYLQHLSYSSLRAIETRRDIARCANTGISAFINQRGDIVDKTNWWRRETLEGNINISSRETFFVKYGDIAGLGSTALFLLLLLILIIKAFIPAKK